MLSGLFWVLVDLGWENLILLSFLGLILWWMKIWSLGCWKWILVLLWNPVLLLLRNWCKRCWKILWKWWLMGLEILKLILEVLSFVIKQRLGYNKIKVGFLWFKREVFLGCFYFVSKDLYELFFGIVYFYHILSLNK